MASEDDLAIARYDELSADEIVSKLGELSQIDLAKVDSYERKHQNRTTVLHKITSARGNEPWPGYDELSVAEIESVLGEADDERAKAVRSYERSRKNRTGVLIFAAVAIFTFSAAAQAAAYLTFVGANGNDANPCTAVSAPC